MANRLADETSPYLLQHAHNPVDWYPWGPEALSRAKAENKPILLSVGYSACHWCHVMERESFEDPDIAARMNRDFVNIKVDREERPDVDEIYMRAVQAMNHGQGGWPMTVFLLPDGRPFWGGTYFPPQPRHGMPSFPQVLAEMARLFHESASQVERIGAEMADWLERTSQMPEPQRTLRGDWLARVAASGDEVFDEENGGLGRAPKFPPHGMMPVWLAHARVTGDADAMRRLTQTLDAMARGGMYDQLAGGFARYSVDAAWRIPHFEKMLYDNGQLIPVYVDAWKVTKNPHYARVVRESVGWLLRDMRLPGGAFAAATDADSEGEEGRYFCWTPAELDAALGADGKRAAELLQVTSYGTFEHGTSVLRLEEPLERLEPADRALLERSLPKLLAVREQRVPPARDDKVVTAWNGLVIGALARAGAALGEPGWIEAAEQAASFLLESATVDGRLMRTWKDGRSVVLGCADDHANLLAALLDLWEATFDQRWLMRANALADRLVALFWDTDGGGLFFTGSDAPALVTRSKHLNGGAEPSANEVAALAFVRLARLCGREDLGAKAAVILGGLQPTLVQIPRALGPGALAGHWWTQGGVEIGLAGDVSQGEGARLLAAVRARYLPFAVVAARRKDEPYVLLPWLLGKVERGGPTAYVCEGHTCKLPASDPEILAEQLEATTQPRAPRSPVRVRAPELPGDPAAWLGSAPRSLESLRGNVVVLDFWTSCCANCHHVLPALAEVEARFTGEPVVVIGVHSAKFDAEKLPANVVAAVERLRIRHPVILDPDHALWSQYAIKSWPTLVLLDPTGRVAWDQPGEVSGEVLGERVAALLAEGRERGTLGEAVWRRPEATPSADGLRFPGRVSTWAELTADPWAGEVRLYVSDSGNGRVVEAALARGADGWPEVIGSRFVAGFSDPQGTARWRDRLYVADPGDQRVKTIDLRTGEVTALIGSGELGRGTPFDAGKPLTIGLRSPVDVAVSGDEDSDDDVVVFVAMAGNHQVWIWMGEERKFGVFAGTGREAHVDGALDQAAFAQPSGIALHGAYAFVADAETSSLRAVDFQAQKVLTVFGEGLFDWGDHDGPAAEARAQHPLDVAAVGNTVYVADTYNGKLKAFDLHEGALRTVAGGFWEPGGVDVVGGFVVVADTNHHRVVVVEPRTGETRVLDVTG